MKFLPLVWAALRRKPARTLLTCFSIVTAFFLFGTLQGINVGIAKIMELTSRSHLMVMSRVNQGAPMPLAHAAQIRVGARRHRGRAVQRGDRDLPASLQSR